MSRDYAKLCPNTETFEGVRGIEFAPPCIDQSLLLH